jgi:alpha-L-rhamnosidase
MRSKLASVFLACTLTICLAGCKQPGTSVSQKDKFSGAEWIMAESEDGIPDSLRFLDHPAPLFRKSFKVNDEVSKATLTITAAGYYEARINGSKIGDCILSPTWTNYAKRIYYDTYDLTGSISNAENCLAVELGNGFYNPLPQWMWGNLNLRQHLPVGTPAFIAKLTLEFKNGQRNEYFSDRTWKYAYGPIRRNNVYRGEYYDARKEIKGWNMPGFSDFNWKHAEIAKNPPAGGELKPIFFPPVRVIEKVTPVNITEPEKGVYIFDMGINFTGLFDAKVSGNEGDSIFFTLGERLYENGKLNPMTAVCGQIKNNKKFLNLGDVRVAKQQHCYIIGKGGKGEYLPKFSFHTYRYAEVRGLKYKPEVTDFTGRLIHTDVANAGEFSSSSELLNKIQEITRRTFMANLIHVQSDCPAREKFGYGGDLAVTSESFINNYDMHAFYKKTVYDWIDAMRDSVFIDTAPFVGIIYCGLSWEYAFLLVQNNLLNYYGDSALVKELYNYDLGWMEKAKRMHPTGLVDKTLGDHESLGVKTTTLIGTANYYEAARIMERFARMMGDKANQEKFTNLAEQIRGVIIDNFWKKPVNFNRQTHFATLLYYDILGPQEKKVAVDSLLKAVKEGINGHFTTGIFGTKYILESLSQNGYADKVYDIVNSTDFPGWGFMISRGATTVWETWKESDNVYSNCHPMFGTVTEWFYRWLGGIRINKDVPGFSKFTLGPNFPNGLNSVNCSYNTPQGKIVSKWQRSGNRVNLNIEIPKNSEAELVLPKGNVAKITLDNKEYKLTNGKLVPGVYQVEFMIAGK